MDNLESAIQESSSDDELRKRILVLEWMIHSLECFNAKDITYLELPYREADRWGWDRAQVFEEDDDA